MPTLRPRVPIAILLVLAAGGLTACAADGSAKSPDPVWRGAPRGGAYVHERQPAFAREGAEGARPVSDVVWRAAPRGERYVARP